MLWLLSSTRSASLRIRPLTAERFWCPWADEGERATDAIYRKRRIRTRSTLFWYTRDADGKNHLYTKDDDVPDNRARELLYEIYHFSALKNLAFPVAKEIYSTTSYHGPPDKFITLRAQFSYPFEHYYSQPLPNNHFLVGACQIQIDFQARIIRMQIPYRGWLPRPENRSFYTRVENDPIFKTFARVPVDGIVNPVVAALDLVLDTTAVSATDSLAAHTRSNIMVLQEIGGKLGLPGVSW